MLSLERILLKNGVLQDSDLARAETAVKNYGGQLEDVLLGQGACSEEDILAANAELFGVKTYQQWLAENSLQAITEVTNAYELGKSGGKNSRHSHLPKWMTLSGLPRRI